jgi:hypothetical protein
MFNPKDFFTETFVRIISKSPKYFVYVQWATAILFLLPWLIEKGLPSLSIDVPVWLHFLNNDQLKSFLVGIFAAATLTKKDPNELPSK